MGALEDGVKSILRYIKNNYFDGPRQVSDGSRLTHDDVLPR